MNVNATTDYVSIGQLAAHLQVPVRRIEVAMLELNIAPAMRLNLVPYFDAAQVDRLTDRLASAAAGRELPSILDPRCGTPGLRRGIH